MTMILTGKILVGIAPTLIFTRTPRMTKEGRKMRHIDYHVAAQRISCLEDGVLQAYTRPQMVELAKECLGLFCEGGNDLSADLVDDDPEVRKNARQERRQLSNFIMRYDD